MSVVIPARNAARTLADQLEAVMQQHYDGDLEVIVVDNGSTDETRDVAERFVGRKWPLQIATEPVPGVNRARNAGASAASGEVILLCDADDVVESGWVDGIVRALQHADVVGGVLDYSPNTAAVRELWGITERVRPSARYVGFESPWGGNCGFRRATWAELGGFDRDMSGAMDDIEFFVRAQLAGARLQFAEGAIVSVNLRSDPRSVLRRRYQNGVGEALLTRRFGTDKSAGQLAKMALMGWAWLTVAALPALVRRDLRWKWRKVVARRWGRIAGSFRYRVFSP